jgi:hypothetical protein
MKPVLHGRHWMAITGKPLGATAGAMIFQKGGNAVDATCAMLGAVSTQWDTLGWGGETQALIYNPTTGKVIGINALGAAPTGATPEFYRGKEMSYPPEYGPLAAVTPGTPGGLMVMLASMNDSRPTSRGHPDGRRLRPRRRSPTTSSARNDREEDRLVFAALARGGGGRAGRGVVRPISPPRCGSWSRRNAGAAAGKSRKEAIYAHERFRGTRRSSSGGARRVASR